MPLIPGGLPGAVDWATVDSKPVTQPHFVVDDSGHATLTVDSVELEWLVSDCNCVVSVNSFVWDFPGKIGPKAWSMGKAPDHRIAIKSTGPVIPKSPSNDL